MSIFKKILGRAAAGGAIFGGGQLGAELLQDKKEKMEAYMGKKSFASLYGGGADLAQSVVSTGGILGGLGVGLAAGKILNWKAGLAAGAGIGAMYGASSYFHHSGSLIGYGGALGGAAVAGGLMVGKIAKATKKAKSMFVNRAVGTYYASLVPFAAGAGYGDATAAYQTPEGNITSMTTSDSPVRKMNYSTAGLGLAIHRNNRRMT